MKDLPRAGLDGFAVGVIVTLALAIGAGMVLWVCL